MVALPDSGVSCSGPLRGRGIMSLRIVLADDHLVLRQGLRALLAPHGVQVVGEAADGRVAVELVRELRPADAVLEIADACPETQVILLTALEDERYVMQGLREGVRGFVLKTQAAEDLVRAIQEVARGGIYVSAGVSQVLVDACKAAAAQAAHRLTSRERQVVQLVAEGKSTKQIAAALQIALKTVEFHRMRVMKKLEIHDVAGLVRYAIRE